MSEPQATPSEQIRKLAMSAEVKNALAGIADLAAKSGNADLQNDAKELAKDLKADVDLVRARADREIAEKSKDTKRIARDDATIAAAEKGGANNVTADVSNILEGLPKAAPAAMYDGKRPVGAEIKASPNDAGYKEVLTLEHRADLAIAQGLPGTKTLPPGAMTNEMFAAMEVIQTSERATRASQGKPDILAQNGAASAAKFTAGIDLGNVVKEAVDASIKDGIHPMASPDTVHKTTYAKLQEPAAQQK